jgi:hypothetical protein
MQWDAAMVRAWRENWNTSRVAAVFMNRNHIDLAEFMAIQRTPRHSAHFKRPVRAFVSQHLPTLSSWLWDSGWPDAAIVLKLADSKIDTQGGGMSLFLRELCAEECAQRSTVVVHQQRGHRRSDWSVCKA